jgi:uncharacterized protein (TIGR02996 family)
MNDHDALMSAICNNVWEDTPRLLFADWLEENGKQEFAEFIRVQVAESPTRGYDLWPQERMRRRIMRLQLRQLMRAQQWGSTLSAACKFDVYRAPSARYAVGQGPAAGCTIDFPRRAPDPHLFQFGLNSVQFLRGLPCGISADVPTWWALMTQRPYLPIINHRIIKPYRGTVDAQIIGPYAMGKTYELRITRLVDTDVVCSHHKTFELAHERLLKSMSPAGIMSPYMYARILGIEQKKCKFSLLSILEHAHDEVITGT